VKNRVQHLARGVLAFALSGLAGVTLNSQENRLRPAISGAGDRVPWLSWDQSARIGFVRGFLVGVRSGYRNGCNWYDDFAGPKSYPLGEGPFQKCVSALSNFSKSPEVYAKQITIIYQTYPESGHLLLEELMMEMSDSEFKSLKDIGERVK
jgi:hypothetical protein